MKRIKRLKPVVEYTAENEAEAAKALKNLSEKISAAQAHLEELRHLQVQYAARLHQQNQNLSGLQLSEYQAFLAKLGNGIRDQEAHLVQLRQDFAAAQQRWRQAYCRHKGVQKVHDNLLKRSLALTDRALQREMDDLSGRKKRSRSS